MVDWQKVDAGRYTARVDGVLFTVQRGVTCALVYRGEMGPLDRPDALVYKATTIGEAKTWVEGRA